MPFKHMLPAGRDRPAWRVSFFRPSPSVGRDPLSAKHDFAADRSDSMAPRREKGRC